MARRLSYPCSFSVGLGFSYIFGFTSSGILHYALDKPFVLSAQHFSSDQ